jgi:hypothetical protein
MQRNGTSTHQIINIKVEKVHVQNAARVHSFGHISTKKREISSAFDPEEAQDFKLI